MEPPAEENIMSYTLHYSGSKKEMESQARQSCIDYLGGQDRYDLICSRLRAELHRLDYPRVGQRYQALRLAIPFAGISGYWPIRAMVRDILDCSFVHGPHNACPKCAT